jgi:hypothetical protein
VPGVTGKRLNDAIGALGDAGYRNWGASTEIVLAVVKFGESTGSSGCRS